MTPTAKRELVAWAAEAYQLSTRRACHATGVARSIVTYRSCRPSQAPLRARLRELARTRISWGYRRLYLLLRREGWTIRVRRLYRAEVLQLARRRPKRRKTVTARPDAAELTAANQRWAMDFVHDVLLTGEKIRVLTVIDRYTRECLALVPQPRFSSAEVGAVLHAVGETRGGLAPVIQADQGTEFTSMALDQWAYWNHVTLAFGRPGTPSDNAHCEAFNATLRRELLSQHWFASLAEAHHHLETWRAEYNNTRPHRTLAN
ncbi:MAG: IS3 family transposase [Gemmatimonadetes bacterium]|nr:IS3 family transposase [Gemmatimonadota bacterium]